MSSPLVSLCMIVFNGERFLRQILDSLLAQDCGNIEIIILDNQSNDNTASICRFYSEKDSRIRFIVDSVRVGVNEGHNRVAQYAKGEYFMVVCDDDIYEPDYISTLMPFFDLSDEIGLVYSHFDWINAFGKHTYEGKTIFLEHANSKFENFLIYVKSRCVLPMIFGVFKTEVYKKALPYAKVSKNCTWDIDNIFMLRFLTLAKVHSVNKILFHYRERDRSNTYPKGYPADKLKKIFYRLSHQARVTSRIYGIIKDSSFSGAEKMVLTLYIALIWLYYCFILPIVHKMYCVIAQNERDK